MQNPLFVFLNYMLFKLTGETHAATTLSLKVRYCLIHRNREGP
jgi:hypothetical protein